MDDADLCLHKGSTSVLSSAGLIARRKRMEIRRFKKLSKSTYIHDDLFPIAESSVICIKRARIERAATTGSLLETFEVSDTLTSAWHTEKTLPNRFGNGMEAADLIDFGLLSYKSLPLGNILRDHVNDATMNSGGLGVHVSMNEGKLSNSSSVSFEDQRVEEDSPMEEVCSTSCCGSSSMSIGPETTKSGNIDVLAKSDGSVVLGDGIATLEPIISNHIAEIDDNEVCAPKTLTCIQSIDHTSVEHPRHRICPPCGKLLVCGRRREMEDMSTIAPSFAQVNCGKPGSCFCPGKFEDQISCDLHFFAVYDGHGGSQASTYCRERLHHALAEELSSLCSADEGDRDGSEGASSSSTWEKAMETCFSKVDREVGGVCPNGQCDVLCDGNLNCCGDSIAPDNVGTTAVVAVVSSCQIVVANCGDSRAVLSRGGVAIPLSSDHKPERADETSRIEAAGGRVIYWDGYRVGGLLALSRSIGDRYLKQFVVSEPEVTRLQRVDDDECLILASDGLWDVINNDTACEIARKCLNSSRKKRIAGRFPVVGADPAAATAAALLVKLAYGRGSKDNISVVVIDLKS